jgi:hypothetical protein
MTKEEAIQAMREGKKVTHRHFTSKEWMKISPGGFEFEDGVIVKPYQFWEIRGEDWETDWEIYKD